MNQFLNSIAIIMFLGLLVLAFGCKNIKKFKDSRNELKGDQVEQIADSAEVSEDEVAQEEILEQQSDSLFFSYEKTPCFGRCPIFKLSIYNSGFAIYNGTNFVDFIGEYKYTFDENVMNELKSAIQKADFFNMQDAYDNEQVMDIPAKIVEAQFDGQKKKVIGRYNLPAEFKELTKTLDKIFENTEWQTHSQN